MEITATINTYFFFQKFDVHFSQFSQLFRKEKKIPLKWTNNIQFSIKSSTHDSDLLSIQNHIENIIFDSIIDNIIGVV